MKRLLKLILACSSLAACETALRAPVCQDREMEFPAGAEGRYRISVPGASAAYGGAYVASDGIEFIIREDTEGLTINAYGGNPLALLRGAGIGEKAKRGGDAGNDDPMTPWMPIYVCKIGGQFYSQGFDDATGTYSISRFDLAPNGITTVGLVWSPDELEKAGIGKHFLPQGAGFSDGKWTFDGSNSLAMIIDNLNMSPDQRMKLLSLAHPSLIGMVFSRVPEPSLHIASGKPTLTLKIRR